MEAVLWDIFKADEYIKRHVSQDSTKNGTEENRKLQMQIFTLHKITKESFDKSYAYYMSNTELMKNILDSISIKGTSEKYSLYKKPSGPIVNSEK